MSAPVTLPRSITATQRRVIDRLWAGKRVRVIARELGMRVPTVRAHIRAVAAQLAKPYRLPAVRLICSYNPATVDQAASAERD